MSADTYGSLLGLILLGTGNDNNTWGETWNSSYGTPAETAIAGVNQISTTGGLTDLSTVVPPAGQRLDLAMIQIVSGAITSDVSIKVPNVSKLWWFQNNTTGAFNMYVGVPGASAPPGLVQIPQGLNVLVMCDGNGNLTRHDDADIGSFRLSGKSAAGAGELACNGASLLITEFPNLYAKIGTNWGQVDSFHFTVPLLTDTGRFLRSSSASLTVGTYLANQNLSHTHAGSTFSGSTGTESAAHSHNGSGTTSTESAAHTHNYGTLVYNGQNAPANGNQPCYEASTGTTGPENSSHTHSYSFTTSGENATHTHSFSGTTGTTPASGGTEARPETAVVLACIRY